MSEVSNGTGTRKATVCLDDLPGPDTEFIESYVKAGDADLPEVPRRLPRSWTQVEAMVEARLVQFEDRHSRECTAQFEQGVKRG